MTLAAEPWMSVRPAHAPPPVLPTLTQRGVGGGNSMRVGLLLGLLGLLNAVDLAFTLFAYRIGMLDEMNPLAAAYLAAGLKPSFIAYKLLMYLAGSVMLWRVRKSPWSGPACWIMVAVYVGLAWLWYQWVGEVLRIFEIRTALMY